jgi:hypothetical protein
MMENSATYGSAINSVGELDLIKSVVENNAAYGYDQSSGTIIVAGTTLIADTRISGNSASYGAGLDNRGGEGQNKGSTTITRSDITGNRAREGGGGIFNRGEVTLTNSTVSGNSAGNYAGGIYNMQTAVAEIESSTISGNMLGDSVWAYAVSGIYNEGEMAISNSTVSGNYTIESVEEPAAVFQNRDGASLTLRHTTIAGNEQQTADRGYGLHVLDGSVSIFNTLAAGNGKANCQMEEGAPFAGSVNLADDRSCDEFLFTDMLALGPLADNGGLTETRAIGEESAARDAGNAAWCLETDQRGVARSDGQCDVGAYEYVPAGVEGNVVLLPVVIGD